MTLCMFAAWCRREAVADREGYPVCADHADGGDVMKRDP